jgi:hypothetical protein
MFEYDQDIVENLLTDNQDFRRMYEKHGQLKQRVRDANLGTEAVDELSLETMKKEKLLLKDRMAAIIEDYRHAHG